MKILHINSASNWGGGEVHTFELCSHLIKNNYQIMLACRPHSPIEKKFREVKIPVKPLPLRSAIDFFSAFQLFVYCRENKINTIHCHLAQDYWIARCVKILYPQAKLIFTRHLTNPIHSNKLHKWLFSKVEKVISVSGAVRESLIRQELMPKEKIVTIYNGIDINKFYLASPAPLKRELKLKDETKLIGIVGQISPHKGQEVLIKSFPAIVKKMPQSVLIIIGSDFSEGQYIRKLKGLSETLGVSDKIYFLGLRSDIPNLLKTLDVFVLASEYEAFGLAVAEAMAAGVPVVANDIDGLKELVINEQTGLSVKPKNPTALTESIIKILQSPDLKEKFVSESLKRVKQLFSVESMTKSVIRIYEQL